MSGYQTADFNDPAVCQSVDATNLARIEGDQFLSYLRAALNSGVVQPNLACLEVLQKIVSLPLALNSLHFQTKGIARIILDGFFYSLNLQSSQNESKAETIRADDSNLSIPSSIPRKNNYVTELTGLQSDLASILGDYYSTCALVTEDGKHCGLGLVNGFRFAYPGASPTASSESAAPGEGSGEPNEFVDCRQECVEDLCPQWLTSLTSRVPTVVTITGEDGKVTNADIDVVEIESSDVNLYFSFQDGKQIAPPVNYSGICRLLNAPRKDGILIGIVIHLKSKNIDQGIGPGDPYKKEMELERSTISFPEFENNKYFVGDNLLWSYDRGSWYATLSIPPRK